MARKKHLINVHTGTGTTAPTNASLYLGEIAVQHTPENPGLWIKMGTSESSTDYEKFIGETEIYNEFHKTNHNIPYVIQSGDTYTGSTGNYTASTDELTELVDGQSIIFHPKRNSNTASTYSASTCSLNLELADGTMTGAKPIYLYGNTKVTTHLKGCSDIKLTYHENATVSATTGINGWWVDFYYDSNSDVRAHNLYYANAQRTVTGNTLGRYRLMLSSADENHWVSINTSTATSATATKTITSEPIDPHGPIAYYSTTTTIAAGSYPSASYVNTKVSAVTIGYSFVETLTARKPVFLKCTPQADGSALIDHTTPFVQDLPNTEDGKIYIFLGVAASATIFELYENKPVYEYKNGHVRIYQESSDILGPSYTYSGLPYVTSATSIADAYSALTNELFKDEEVISAAFNDLNDRIDNIHVDMILGSGYTYSGIPYVNSATTLADAYSALTSEVIDNEEVTAEALNDLNDRVIEISGNVANIHVDMILGSGYTYSGLPYVNSATTIADAYSAITKVVIDDERVIAEAFNQQNDRIIEISGNVANIHVDMILGSGYTYSGIPYVNSATTIADAYSALTNEVILDELVFASAVNDLNDRVDTKIETTVGDSGMLPNVVYELGTVGGSASFELAPPTKTSIVNHYYWTFDTGTLVPTVTWPSGISKWAGNCVQNGSPVLVANAHYEVSIMDGYAFIVGV